LYREKQTIMKKTILTIICYIYLFITMFTFVIGICIADSSIKWAYILMFGSAFLIWIAWPRIEQYLDDDKDKDDEV